MSRPASAGLDLVPAALAATAGYSTSDVAAILERPVIILSAPRSGSALLFELMLRLRGAWSIGGESHAIYNAFPHLRAENARLDSGSLDAGQADPRTCERLRAAFLFLLKDHAGRRYLDRPPAAPPAAVRLIEKTPRNALNIPFLLQVFPDARFIYLYREPRAAVASLIEAWSAGLETGRFSTFPDLPGWDRRTWCFLLPRGWRSMIGKSLAEIAAFQWSAANTAILEQLDALAPERWAATSFDALVDQPRETVQRLAAFANVEIGGFGNDTVSLPVSRTALTPPQPDKWRKHEAEIRQLLPALEAVSARIEALCDPA